MSLNTTLALDEREEVLAAPIICASKDHHLKDALDLTLSDDDIAELEAPYEAQRVAGHS